MKNFFFIFFILCWATFSFSQEIFLGEKKYENKTDTIFIDNFGREAYFRGWNISGAVKLNLFLSRLTLMFKYCSFPKPFLNSINNNSLIIKPKGRAFSISMY